MSTISWPDYVVFASMLILSILIGLYFAYQNRHQSNPEQFLMAGRKMQVLPVSFSILVSFFSAISFTSDPVECYRFGFIYIMMAVGYVLALVVMSQIAPKYQELHITSMFEILDMRYAKGMRIAMCVGCVVQMVFYQGVVLYAPSLAISQACGISIWSCIIGIGAVCTIYTTIGGMRAVVWTDAIQMAIMLSGLVAIVTQGSIRLGGLRQVFSIAEQGGRLNFKTAVSNMNPLARASVWVYLFGGFFRLLTVFMANQHIVQRFCIVRTKRDTRNALLLTIPANVLMTVLFGLCGLILYGIYRDCDPLLNGEVQRRDQLMPLLIMDILGYLPGVTGLFLATLLCASLSTLSSGMNSLAAIGLPDVVAPVYQRFAGVVIPERTATLSAKALVITSGVLITGMAIVTKSTGSSIFYVANIFAGVLNGPCCAVFLLALYFPKIKPAVVYVSWGVGMAACLVLSVMAFIFPPREPWEELPLSTSGCDVTMGDNITTQTMVTQESNITGMIYRDMNGPGFQIGHLYHLNPILYAPFGLGLVSGIAALLQLTEYIRTRVFGPAKSSVTVIYMDEKVQTKDDRIEKHELSC